MKEFGRKKAKIDMLERQQKNELSNWKMKLKMEFNQILKAVSLTVRKITQEMDIAQKQQEER